MTIVLPNAALGKNQSDAYRVLVVGIMAGCVAMPARIVRAPAKAQAMSLKTSRGGAYADSSTQHPNAGPAE
ncbi:hypothetical protein CPBF367_20410 [Xanthomonas arboricola pv. juglandis]|nr:hypothetical protein CPBF367_20410 [Xanthomonas arboricola pv. juglandis]